MAAEGPRSCPPKFSMALGGHGPPLQSARRSTRMSLFQSGIPAAQKSVDQLRQVVAVAAFENCSGWNFYASQPFPESCEVVTFQRHLGNWVVLIRIEPR